MGSQQSDRGIWEAGSLSPTPPPLRPKGATVAAASYSQQPCPVTSAIATRHSDTRCPLVPHRCAPTCPMPHNPLADLPSPSHQHRPQPQQPHAHFTLHPHPRPLSLRIAPSLSPSLSLSFLPPLSLSVWSPLSVFLSSVGLSVCQSGIVRVRRCLNSYMCTFLQWHWTHLILRNRPSPACIPIYNFVNGVVRVLCDRRREGPGRPTAPQLT
jgi:hypothetical protein